MTICSPISDYFGNCTSGVTSLGLRFSGFSLGLLGCGVAGQLGFRLQVAELPRMETVSRAGCEATIFQRAGFRGLGFRA